MPINHRARWNGGDYMVVAFPELVGEMAKRRLTRTEVAKSLGISTRALYSKISGETDFTLSEANAIHAVFFPDMEKDILFARAEQDGA